MIIGYVIIGIFMGLTALSTALLLGASLWIALACYVGAGTAAVFLLAGIRIARVGREERHTDLPAQTAVSAQAGLAAEGAESSMRIFAVDDDPFILELLPSIAARSGFSQVTLAASGDEALNILTDDSGFDCLLVDISMPEMDGIELCRHIRAIDAYRTTPIIMLTAMRDLGNMGDAFRAGATDYATKPFDVKELGIRLRLAQEEVRVARHNAVTSRPGDIQHHQVSDLLNGLHVDGPDNLVDRAILVTYLTRIPGKAAAGVEVLALRTDSLELINDQLTSQEFADFLADVAGAADAQFSDDKTLMAYTENGDLLIVTESGNHLDQTAMEQAIEQAIVHFLPAFEMKGLPHANISISEPVHPSPERTQRAAVAFGNAVALVEIRASKKRDWGQVRRIS